MCVMGSWRVALRTMDKEMAMIIHETTMHVNPTPRMFTSREWYSQVIYVSKENKYYNICLTRRPCL
jgi:hypothetical protein